LKRSTDILIIGGGILGLSTAYYAAISKLGKVTLIENDKIGRGASSRNIGAIREQFDNAAMINLMRLGIDLWERLPADLEWNLLFDQKGRLTVARSEETLKRLTAAVELQNNLGVKSELLTSKETVDMVPFVNQDDLHGAAFNARDGMIHHDAVLWAFERALRRNGVEVLEGVKCRRLNSTGGRASGVETSAGEITADHVVVSAGEQSDPLLQTLGINIPLLTLRREAIVTEPYRAFLPVVFTDAMREFIITQTLRGEIVGDTKYADDSNIQEPEVTLSFAKRMASDVCYNFPSLGRITLLRQWAGIYNTTPDRLGIAGTVSGIEGLLLATGFGGQGFMVAPAIGKSIVEIVESNKTPDVLKPFSCSRFFSGASC
jgi:sarcosine oxidase subunit beta